MDPSWRLDSSLALPAAAIVAVLAGTALVGPALAQDTVEIELVTTDDDSAPFAFDPDRVTVEPGTTVRWVHTHDDDHTVTSTDSRENPQATEDFHAEFTDSGDTFERTFTETGDHHYFCQPHQSFMRGTVTVASGDGGGNGNSSPGAPAGLAVLLIGAAALGMRGRRP